MKLGDAARTAWRSIGRHPVRAGLSIVGILAGAAAVVLLVAVAQSVGALGTATVEGLSPGLVVVYPGGVSSSGIQAGIATRNAISSDDVTALGNPGYVPDGVQAVPTTALRDDVAAQPRVWQTDIIGSTAGFESARGYSVSTGRFFSAAEVGSAASVVVLGATVAENLYPSANPVGQTVRINNQPFTVIGVFVSRGISGTYDQDDLAVIPITASWAYVLPPNAPRIQQVLVQARDAGSTDRVKAEVENTLLQRHHIVNPTLADFQVRTQQDLVAGAEQTGAVMNWTLGAIALIALLTGTVCIMGLMFENVAERRRELHISRVVGASRGDLVTLVLVEALLLACIGGAFGIALGAAATSLTGSILSGLPVPVVSTTGIVIAAVLAIALGAVAGFYPAMRAGAISPSATART